MARKTHDSAAIDQILRPGRLARTSEPVSGQNLSHLSESPLPVVLKRSTRFTPQALRMRSEASRLCIAFISECSAQPGCEFRWCLAGVATSSAAHCAIRGTTVVPVAYINSQDCGCAPSFFVSIHVLAQVCALLCQSRPKSKQPSMRARPNLQIASIC
jgi:hypothetical protein